MDQMGSLLSFVVILVQISIRCECLKNDLTKLSILDDRHMDHLAFRVSLEIISIEHNLKLFFFELNIELLN